MSDKLQQYIDDNREAFDAEEPKSSVWNAVQQKMKGSKSIRVYFRKGLTWAASVAALMILSLTIYSLSRNNGDKIPEEPGSTAAEPTEIIDMIDPMQARQITQFQEIIELKQSELKLLEKEEPVLYKEFISDINSLDSAYSALKSKLPENPNREMLLEAMISNLQLQSELLSRHLKIIKEIKQKNSGHEKQISI